MESKLQQKKTLFDEEKNTLIEDKKELQLKLENEQKEKAVKSNQLMVRIKDLEEKLRRTEEALEQQSDQNDCNKSNLAKFHQETTAKDQELSKLEGNLEEARKSLKQLEKENMALKMAKIELEQRCSEMESLQEKNESTRAEATNRSRLLKDQNTMCLAENARLRNDLNVSKQARRDLENLIDSKNDHIQSLELQIQKLENQISQSKREILNKNEDLRCKINELNQFITRKSVIHSEMGTITRKLQEVKVQILVRNDIEVKDEEIALQTFEEKVAVFDLIDKEIDRISLQKSLLESKAKDLVKEADEKDKNVEKLEEIIKDKIIIEVEKDEKIKYLEDAKKDLTKSQTDLQIEVDECRENIKKLQHRGEFLSEKVREMEKGEIEKMAEYNAKVKEIGKENVTLSFDLEKSRKEVEEAKRGQSSECEQLERQMKNEKDSHESLQKRHVNILRLLHEESEKVDELTVEKTRLSRELEKVKLDLKEQKQILRDQNKPLKFASMDKRNSEALSFFEHHPIDFESDQLIKKSKYPKSSRETEAADTVWNYWPLDQNYWNIEISDDDAKWIHQQKSIVDCSHLPLIGSGHSSQSCPTCGHSEEKLDSKLPKSYNSRVREMTQNLMDERKFITLSSALHLEPVPVKLRKSGWY
ncbi:myosin-11-like [Symsagittifera roscoffensis]|uniref:myosin-11-like n=1 Tax=Symsagittifera roscoffensis TaxID=84072 RepID=UPI00307B8669